MSLSGNNVLLAMSGSDLDQLTDLTQTISRTSMTTSNCDDDEDDTGHSESDIEKRRTRENMLADLTETRTHVIYLTQLEAARFSEHLRLLSAAAAIASPRASRNCICPTDDDPTRSKTKKPRH